MLVLIINNLVVTMMWHRLNVLNLTKDLLQQLQNTFADFFSGMATIPWESFPCSPVNEGGQGLIDLQPSLNL